jgi:hypothetical protein
MTEYSMTDSESVFSDASSTDVDSIISSDDSMSDMLRINDLVEELARCHRGSTIFAKETCVHLLNSHKLSPLLETSVARAQCRL